jgi:serine/threonine-protein kinase
MHSDGEAAPGRIACAHCGGSHRAGLRRCPATGRALGGDARLIGQLIDKRYRVVRLLGDGPFGAVYKAEHVTVGRNVALRILPAALLEHPVALNRFFREARLMSSVNQRRLQPLLDAGLSGEGVAYVAYQYVRGRSLAAALASEAPFSLARACTTISQILEGLEAIHLSGFVHRALAPDSVLMQITASGVEQVLLTNFGAAALEERSSPLDVAAARPAIYVPNGYVPPERLRGAPPDRREDLFAAGVMLSASLSSAGVPRFGGDLLAARVPPTIEAIVARAVHPSPSARFPSAGEMRAALAPFVVHDEDEPASATKTHISDLRALARRERALGTLPIRLRVGGDPSRRSQTDGAFATAVARALQALLPGSWRELCARVPSLDQVAARDPRDVGDVPLVIVAAALEEADALGGAGDRLFCSVVGERTLKTGLGDLLRRESAGITPEFFFDQMATSWAARFLQGSSRASQVGRGYGRLEVRDQAEPSLAMCSCLTGILGEALHSFGVRTVEINKTSCESVGDPACVYSATWS